MSTMVRVKQILAALLLCILAVFGSTNNVHAGTQQSSSTNYGVSEVNFGSGGDLHDCSTNYCAKTSVGELTQGNTASTNYQAQAGFNTDRNELLEVSVSSSIINLGTLSASSTKTGTGTFSVRTYLSSGYIVTIKGNAPTNSSGGHQLTPMSTADISRTGVEQFGLNLMANTTPAVGANPVEVPDSTFSFGAAATGYNTANTFKFTSGDTIASSSKSSGTTNYTMSVIENSATSTPAGVYKTNLVIGVVPTF